MTQRNPPLQPAAQRADPPNSATSHAGKGKPKSRQAESGKRPLSPASGSGESVGDRCQTHLSPDLMHLLDAAGRVGDEAGMPVYAVGGFVRDLLLGVKNDDLDLTVEGDGIAFAQRLAAALGGSSRRPSAFGTAVVLAPDGHKIDVASARRETYQHPAALPRVEPGSIRDDLFRRDFSVNTLAFALNGPEAFVLLDWYGGRADLAEGCIRVLHNRSYRDDPTRIFRAIRLEQRFGFTLHLHTVRLLGRAVEKRWIEQLSGTRLWRELRLMLEGTSPIQCLTRLDEFGVLSQIDPALTLSPERVAMLARVADARTELVEIAPDMGTCAWLVYLAAALQGSPADVTRRICARLTLSPRIAETLTGGIAAVERAAHRLQSALEVPPSQIVAALQMVPLDLLPLLMGASPEREAHERIRQYLRTLRHVQPSLSGHDLKRLGVPQGPLIGRVLTRVRAAKLDGEAPTREAEESVVRNAVAQEGTMPQSCL